MYVEVLDESKKIHIENMQWISMLRARSDLLQQSTTDLWSFSTHSGALLFLLSVSPWYRVALHSIRLERHRAANRDTEHEKSGLGTPHSIVSNFKAWNFSVIRSSGIADPTTYNLCALISCPWQSHTQFRLTYINIEPGCVWHRNDSIGDYRKW